MVFTRDKEYPQIEFTIYITNICITGLSYILTQTIIHY